MQGHRFQVEEWYMIVTTEPDRLVDALTYYDRVRKDGERFLIARGNLEELLATQAGTLYYYEQACNDAEKIKKFLEEKIDYEFARRYKWYLTSEEAKVEYKGLKITDIKQLIEAEDHMRELTLSKFYVSAACKSLGTLCERLNQRGIYISMISKLRSAGVTEIMIDVSIESD